MTRLFITPLVLIVLVANMAMSDEKKPAAKLKVGDPAPALKVTKWLRGAEVKALEPGSVYVVEFWATWCGPCIQMMPHLGDLQEEYRDKGVTVIGFTCEDSDEEDKVAKFVEARGAKLGYTFAFAKDSATNDAYMKASGQNGIPCSFVVNKEGKIAYIGHPLFLDVVLPKVVDGTWDIKTGADEIAAADKAFDAAFEAMSDPGAPVAGLKALADFGAKWPKLVNNPYMNQKKLDLLVKAKKYSEVNDLAKKLLAKATLRGDTSSLQQMSAALRDETAKGQPELTALSIKAAETAYAVDEKNPRVVRGLLEAYKFAGDEAKVKEFGPKAVAAAVAALEGDKDAIGTLQVAAAYLATGDTQKAKATAEKAIGMVDAKSPLRDYVEREATKYGAKPPKSDKEEKNDK